MKFSFIKCNNIDKSLNWTFREDFLQTPAIITSIKGRNYQISNFSYIGENYLFIELQSLEDALHLSLSIYHNINIVELSKLSLIIKNLNLDYKSFDIFNKKNIKGKNSFEVLNKINFLPIEILNYLVLKEIPFKTISLICSFSENLIIFLKDYLNNFKEPTVSEFINFINNMADFKELIENINYEPNFTFPEKISHIRKEFEDILKEINNKNFLLKVTSKDFFENGKVEFSFTASSNKEVQNISDILKNNLEVWEKLFNKMKENNIC